MAAGIALSVILPLTAAAADFGSVVPIGGHASDIALDERRGVVYVANFAMDRVDVLSTADHSWVRSLPFNSSPAALAISANDRYLLVARFGGETDEEDEQPERGNGVTIFDFDAGIRRDIELPSPALTVAFGADDFAIVVTTTEIFRLEVLTGALESLGTIGELANAELERLATEKIPVPFATFPAEITKAAAAASGDHLSIYGFCQAGNTSEVFFFLYDIRTQVLRALLFTSSPDLGPRVTSVNQDGSLALLGWALLTREGILLAQFRGAEGRFDLGGHTFDPGRNVLYAQIPAMATEGSEDSSSSGGDAKAGPKEPVLTIRDTDNLTVRERLRLPESFTGRVVLDSKGETLYAASQSGLMILPVGSLDQAARVWSAREDVLFEGNTCAGGASTHMIDLFNPGGGHTAFELHTDMPGIRISSESGVTPATVEVSVDFEVFRDHPGTSVGSLEIHSAVAINVPAAVRLLVNVREPDQRGTIVNVPGRLVDILPDPVRNRFYVLRQDKNLVLVFDASTLQLVTTLRTGNTPWSMEIAGGGRYLLVGNDDSQLANIFDLDRLEALPFIPFPGGHYPRSIAAAGNTILAASRVAGPEHQVDFVDLGLGVALTPEQLGIFVNSIDENTVLSASLFGGSIFAAQADGTVFRYDTAAERFGASRRDYSELGGAYGTIDEGRFVAETHVMNTSLVAEKELDANGGEPSGVGWVDGFLVRTLSPAPDRPGLIQRVDLTGTFPATSVKLTEAPVIALERFSPFSRTLAPLVNRDAIVSLSTSGLLVLPWYFDRTTDPPEIESVVSAADGALDVAIGEIIQVRGRSLSSVSLSSGGSPLPTVLGETCVELDGELIPLFQVSPGKIVAQLPFTTGGAEKMIVRAAGGLSAPKTLTVLSAAPGIFHTATAGPLSDLPAVYRQKNGQVVTLSNPIHPDDYLVIYLAGLGATEPPVAAGNAAACDPLALVVSAPTVTLGGVQLGVEFAGLVPGEIGVYQVNAFVPVTVPIGWSIPLVIDQGGQSTTLDVRVVD